MTTFDLEKTQQVARLFQVPAASRDAAWQKRFYAAIPDASMSAEDPQTLVGPDGFPYFILKLPEAGVAFETYSLRHIVDFCYENGVGIVLNPQKNPPDYVFAYGNLWSWKATGEFYRDTGGLHGVSKETLTAERGVLVGQPSESYFPTIARKVVARFLHERLGVETPSCLLLNDAASKPVQSLVFNAYRDDFEDEKVFAGAMYLLRWYLPNDYVVTAIDRSSELATHFTPLV